MRLHFAELNTAVVSGTKRFDLIINGISVLASFDIYAAAGGRFKAIVKEFPFTTSSTGGASVKFNIIKGTSSINGMEVVLKPLTGVSLDRESAIMNKGDTIRLMATFAPSDVTNKYISWKSPNLNVAQISASGLVTGIGTGRAIITVKTDEGEKTDSVVVVISDIVANLFDTSNEACFDVIVYPNPTSQGHLALKLRGYQNEKAVKLIIADVSGSVVFKAVFQTEAKSEQVVQIKDQNLDRGLYIISVISKTAKRDIKVLVK